MDGVRTTSEYDPKMIEAMESAADRAVRVYVPSLIKAALSALPLTPEALNAIWRGEAVVVNETTGLPYLDTKKE